MQIDFWFSIGSTYTYLSVMRMGSIEREKGVSFVWHPFSVREIMKEMDNIPFAHKPAKARYMWRDIERRAAGYGFKPRLPAPYPLAAFDLANRVAIVGAQEGWCADYVIATYRGWMEDGEPAGEEPNLSRSLREAGQDPDRVLSLATSDGAARAYAEATDEARSLGIFGSPNFIVDGELFWGDDRLEEAVAWPGSH